MSVLNYGEPEYWNVIYNEFDDQFESKYHDFYCNISAIWPIIESSLIRSKTESCLVAGCGRSNICRTLIQNGARNITACDISSTAVTSMMKLHRDIEGIRFMVADVRCMTIYPDQSFSLILDKGCLDSLMSSISCFEDCRLYLNEVERVVRSRGVFVVISHASQDSRVPILSGSAFGKLYPWEVDCFPLSGVGNDYFGPSTLYIMTSPDENGNKVLSRRKVIASYSDQSPNQREKASDEVQEIFEEELTVGVILGHSEIDESAHRPYLFESSDEEDDDDADQCSQSIEGHKTHKGEISSMQLSQSLINRVSSLSKSNKNLG